jgi:hypothetical protein
LYLDDSRLLIVFPFKVLHQFVAKPDQGNTPSSEPIFGVLTGLSRSLPEKPRDMSNETPGITARR